MIGKSEVVIYEARNGETVLAVKLENDTVWLTQKQMSELFGKGIPTINEHIKNLYKEGELEKDSTIRNFRTVQNEGGRSIERDIEFYDLDVIISVGYRVKSKQGTQFRIWARNILKNHIVNGFSVNNDRLKDLQNSFKEQKEEYKRLRYFMNRFLGMVARKDVQDAVIDRVEALAKNIEEIQKLVSGLKKRK